jgi:hypothetical protein
VALEVSAGVADAIRGDLDEQVRTQKSPSAGSKRALLKSSAESPSADSKRALVLAAEEPC